MSSRSAVAVGLLLALAGGAPAQQAQPYNRAAPPDRQALDRLNLRTEWATYLPVANQLDALVMVQTFGDQLFAQTRTGLLIAIDARSGRVQWTANLGNGGPTPVVPVAVNAEYVFAANVTRLYAFYRSTGVVEFSHDMGSVPTVGLVADSGAVYAVLTVRASSAGAQRLIAYDLPRPIPLSDPTRTAAPGSAREGRPSNPVDELARRYPTPGAVRQAAPSPQEMVAPAREGAGAGLAVRESAAGGGRTPSLAVLHRITPPYTAEGGRYTPSLAVLPNLRRPYHLRDEANRDIQKTPSLGVIPPSLGASMALSDLRPKGVTPGTRWEYGLTSRVLFTPTQSSLRLWVATDSRRLLALGKSDRKVEVDGPLWEQVAARPGQAGSLAYAPLADGSLVAVDLDSGGQAGGLNSPWRANLGGYLNHTPLVTADAVYPSGDNAGAARVDRATGRVVWRTADRAADQVIGVNAEFVYVRDRQGRLSVYDAARATAGGGRSVPLTGLDLPAFNLPVVNTVSDRVYVAADTGLLVCLRDASAKYAAPVPMAPEVLVNARPRGGVVLDGGPPGPGGEAEPKDSPRPKVDPPAVQEPEPKKEPPPPPPAPAKKEAPPPKKAVPPKDPAMKGKDKDGGKGAD